MKVSSVSLAMGSSLCHSFVIALCVNQLMAEPQFPVFLITGAFANFFMALFTIFRIIK